jgi:hypothetical protein
MAMSSMHDVYLRIKAREEYFRLGTLELTLASGRTVRYQLQDYPLSVHATDAELDALVDRIVAEKYRYCRWDRTHAKENAEPEIRNAIKAYLMEFCGKASGRDEASNQAE